MKRQRRSVTGVLLLDKPLGISSNAALTRVKILYNADKAGHTGTLDPFASGLLPVCLGEATKFAGYLLNADKTYEATVRLGRVTTTGDREGEVTSEMPVEVTRAAVIDVLVRFTGRIDQVPPMHSALKLQGQPLYRLARQGTEVTRQARQITVHHLDLLAFEPPLLKLRVVCSKGTYIRVLAEDIGKALGCGAMLEDLRRTATGGFSLADALTLEQVGEMSPQDRDALLIGPDRLLQHLPALSLAGDVGRSLLAGRAGTITDGYGVGLYRAYGPADRFFGLVEVAADGRLQPRRMMSAMPE